MPIRTDPPRRFRVLRLFRPSADAAANPEVRRTLRNRARYEVANNSYARGIVLTLANDVIGTGPRLQMLTGSAEANQTIEREFTAWAKAVDLPSKLRTMRMKEIGSADTGADPPADMPAAERASLFAGAG